MPAFSGLFAPHWDNNAQGVLVGLTSFVTKAHIARAVLEATAWQTRDVLDAMNADAGVPALSLAVDGGMTGDNLLMQLVADALDIPVVRPMMAETVALGAAYAAGLAVGYWPDRQVLRRHWQRAGEWRPQIDPARRTAELASWRHAVSLASAWGAPTSGANDSAVGRNRTTRIAQARLPRARGAPSVGSRTHHRIQGRPLSTTPHDARNMFPVLSRPGGRARRASRCSSSAAGAGRAYR